MKYLAHARRTPRSAGFSLIEVIFAIAMLGIGIVGILSLFTAGLSSTAKSQNTTNASLELQSLLTRILSETDNGAPAKRVVLEYIHPTGEAAGGNKHEWIQFDKDVKFGGTEKAVRIDDRRDLFWKCRCRPVHSDRDAAGNIVDWYTPLNPDDPLDTNYKDASKSPNYVDGLYELAIAVYRSQKDDVPDNQRPIVVFSTFVTTGF